VLLEVREPDLDQRPDPLLHPVLARERQRGLVALAHLRGVDALFEPVVAGQDQLLKVLAGLALVHGDNPTEARGRRGGRKVGLRFAQWSVSSQFST